MQRSLFHPLLMKKILPILLFTLFLASIFNLTGLKDAEAYVDAEVIIRVVESGHTYDTGSDT